MLLGHGTVFKLRRLKTDKTRSVTKKVTQLQMQPLVDFSYFIASFFPVTVFAVSSAVS